MVVRLLHSLDSACPQWDCPVAFAYRGGSPLTLTGCRSCMWEGCPTPPIVQFKLQQLQCWPPCRLWRVKHTFQMT